MCNREILMSLNKHEILLFHFFFILFTFVRLCIPFDDSDERGMEKIGPTVDSRVYLLGYTFDIKV